MLVFGYKKYFMQFRNYFPACSLFKPDQDMEFEHANSLVDWESEFLGPLVNCEMDLLVGPLLRFQITIEQDF